MRGKCKSPRRCIYFSGGGDMKYSVFCKINVSYAFFGAKPYGSASDTTLP